MLTLMWRYLSGQVRATDLRDERHVEWPPHPGRVWLALAAQWFQGGEQPEEQEVLELLRRSPEPQVWIPTGTGQARTPVEVYVPINDTAEGGTPMGHLAVSRLRQMRYFPTLHVGEGGCALHWPEVTLSPAQETALRALAGRLTYLGQSGSLITAWVQTSPPPAEGMAVLSVTPHPMAQYCTLRGFTCGFPLAELARWYAAGRSPQPRGLLPYALVDGEWPRNVPENPMSRTGVPEFSPAGDSSPWNELQFLIQTSGAILPLIRTLDVVQGIRQEISRRCPLPLPRWLTGHEPDGRPVRGNTWYTGTFPVGHVGVSGSDGRIVGMALARPRAVDPATWQRTLRPLLRPEGFRVTLADGAQMVLTPLPGSPRGVFHPALWYGSGCVWATMTPVVLDTNSSFLVVNPETITQSMTYSCRLAGLPAPVEVVARHEPWWTGSFAAWGKTGSPLCFPPDRRFARGQLPRFHIWLRFPRPITGPLSLGRLRFQGYGVFWSLPAEMPVISGGERLELRFGRGAQPPQLVVQQP